MLEGEQRRAEPHHIISFVYLVPLHNNRRVNLIIMRVPCEHRTLDNGTQARLLGPWHW